MRYYVVTRYWDYDLLKNSIVKGRDDIFRVLGELGLTPIEIPVMSDRNKLGPVKAMLNQLKIARSWNEALSCVKTGDTVVIHNPPSKRFLLYPSVVRRLRKRGVRIVLDISDLDQVVRQWYGVLKPLKCKIFEIIENSLLRNSDAVVAHNDVMKEYLTGLGIDPERIVARELFDYIMDTPPKRKVRTRDGAAVFAGELGADKAEFLKKLPDNYSFNLYGPNFDGEEKENVCYKGAFSAAELAEAVEGSYGLVWGGDSPDECRGSWGDAILYMNPHKASCYLAMGMPVIIHKDACIAPFIVRNGCGITVSALSEAACKINKLTDEDYLKMCENVEKVARMLRKGDFSRRAYTEALETAEVTS